MNKHAKTALKVVGGITSFFAVAVTAAIILLNTEGVQNWLMNKVVDALKDKLKTEISISKVSVSVLSQQIELKSLVIYDRQHRKMLEIADFGMGLSLWALCHKELVVTKANISGVKANLCKPASANDSTANFQFLIDAFKSQKPKDKSEEKKNKSSVTFNISSAKIEIDSLNYRTGNGIARNNAVNSNKGAFNAANLDICSSLHAKLENISNDGFNAVITKCSISDRASGLTISDIKLRTKANKDSLQLDDFEVNMPNSKFAIPHASVKLPRKEAGQELEYNIPEISTTVDLKDIARPFAPSLAKFKSPIHLECGIKGDANVLQLNYLNAGTNDKRISIKAKGVVSELSSNHRKASLDISSLGFITDNGKPRRNVGKPKRGAFDAGHLDIQAAMHIDLRQTSKDSLRAFVTKCHLADRGSGLVVNSLKLQGDISKGPIQLKNISIVLPHTNISIPQASLQLPSKKEGKALSYSAPTVSGTTQLRDIARPFAPALKNFIIPINFRCALSGDDNNMRFNGVKVSNKDNRLNITATGNISQLKGKRLLHVHFDVANMKASNGIHEQIINQFTVKKFMMKQLRALGTINYRGHFDILYKKEAFAGVIGCKAGNINFQFALDEINKYINGSANTSSLQLGNVMDMPDLGKIACNAKFRFDFSKQRTAMMRRKKGGKLPIGNVEANIQEGSYGIVTVRNVSATINSDGAVADGKIIDRGKYVDLMCGFTFTDTNEMRKTKIKPGIKFHGKRK